MTDSILREVLLSLSCTEGPDPDGDVTLIVVTLSNLLQNGNCTRLQAVLSVLGKKRFPPRFLFQASPHGSVNAMDVSRLRALVGEEAFQVVAEFLSASATLASPSADAEVGLEGKTLV